MVKKQHIFQQLEMGIVFVNEFNIFENERKNEGWMNNLDCSERLKNYSSLKTNEKKYYRLNELEKTIVVILNERMFRKIF